jgi:hypothetical protein
MWSGPRNLSTALMRSFGNREDTAVVDEPFYAAYLAETGLDHPLRAAVLAAQPTDWRLVVDGLLGPVPGGRAVFFQKHMTHHMLPGIDRGFLHACRNAFLIRAPAQVLASYQARRHSVSLEDVGFAQQAELFDAVCQRTGAAPPVIDAADLLADPGRLLQALCAVLGIGFSERMLHWPAGKRATDGVWAPAWYGSVERSTGFDAPTGKDPVLSAELRRIEAACEPFYRRLSGFRLLPT